MPIIARSAPNNGRVKEAKISSCTRGIDKAINRKAKKGDKTDVDRRANGKIRRNIGKAIIENENYDKKRNKIKSRREDKSGNVRGNGEGERWDWEVQPQQQPYPYSLFHSYSYLYS